MKAQFLIAAPASGSGKTTIARGLMALYVKQGLKVQPFKCGPDYIDTKFHEAVCGRPSVNLDTFMASPQHVKELYAQHVKDADIGIVEGMMGLFDGYDRDHGSCAEIARVLGLPIVLVVNARSAAYSMAALLQGFQTFWPDISFAGVVFNQTGSSRHEEMLRQVCDDMHIRCLGCLPRERSLEQGSRYLGLDFSETAETTRLVELIGREIGPALLDATMAHNQDDAIGKHPTADLFSEQKAAVDNCVPPTEGSVMVARSNEAFSFIYQETLERLGDVTFFNPENQVPCLKDCRLLYLPGGYPEKHLEALTEAEATRRSIKDFAEQGGRIVAECGGMMYLCQEIVTDEGAYPMCDVLPYVISARRADRHLSLGYRRFVLEGKEYRGHEFHYTQVLTRGGGHTPQSACQVYDAKGKPVATPVLRYKNVLASYTHLYHF